MKDKIILGIQIVVGLMLVVFGANGFLQFMPMPEHSKEMGDWLQAVYMTVYIFPLIAFIEIVAGLAFLSNKLVALMAIIVMPVVLNATLAHIFLNDIGGVGMALFLTISIALIMIGKKEAYRAIFKA
ncbi:hypothetical protein JHD46_00535 [Sulfurimonas sp. SAG-AH-194-C20]|nr:hypothetical protein [Sulfurimonas sp. SAG-AH-194-C20]MDF1878118.1 hypothetical protein [Sulfurimonas sp. SAG-AH-194-C20]